MNNLMMVAAVSVMLSQALPALADDLEAAKQKAEQVCAACHGAEGNKPFTPETPKLAGQHADGDAVVYVFRNRGRSASGKRE